MESSNRIHVFLTGIQTKQLHSRIVIRILFIHCLARIEAIYVENQMHGMYLLISICVLICDEYEYELLL